MKFANSNSTTELDHFWKNRAEKHFSDHTIPPPLVIIHKYCSVVPIDAVHELDRVEEGGEEADVKA